MAEHYTNASESVIRWCNRCAKHTVHELNCGRLGRCTEHEHPHLTQKQQRRREEIARAAQQPPLFPHEGHQ
jgi:hypothetical protein